MIAVIRIKGRVKVREMLRETLERLRLRKKYVCVLIDEKNENEIGMMKKVEGMIAYGEIDKGTLTRLIEKRGQLVNKTKKIDAEKIAEDIQKGKKLRDLGLKPFFRLHPPRGGLKSSNDTFPKGVMGNHKQAINKLIEKML